MKTETPIKNEGEAPLSVAPSGASTPINILTTLTPSIIRVGCKVFVDKDGEKRLAEILGTRVRKGGLEFYVHYQEFNKVCAGHWGLVMILLTDFLNSVWMNM